MVSSPNTFASCACHVFGTKKTLKMRKGLKRTLRLPDAKLHKNIMRPVIRMHPGRLYQETGMNVMRMCIHCHPKKFSVASSQKLLLNIWSLIAAIEHWCDILVSFSCRQYASRACTENVNR